MKRLLLLLLFRLPSWASWSYYYPLTYDHTQVGSSDSTAFPALVYFSAPQMRDTSHGGDVQSSAGADILFFSDSGLTTQLPSELESYDNVNGAGWFWVQIATLSHSSNGAIYAAVGNASPPARTTGVWDSNYKGVWTFQDPTNPVDSTGNNNGTNHGATAVAGKVASAASLNGSSNYISLASPLQTGGPASFEAWVNVASSGGILGNFTSGWVPDYGFGLAYDGTCILGMYSWSNSNWYNNLRAAISRNVWTHIAVVWPTYGYDYGYLYVNGALAASYETTSAYGSSYSGYVGYGVMWPGYYFGGYIDEARFSVSARSADWILAEYNNQNAPGNIGSAAFWTWGAKEAPSIARRRVVVVQ